MHCSSPRNSRPRSHRTSTRTVEPIEMLESRTMLCMYHELIKHPPTELRPDLLQQALKDQKQRLAKGGTPGAAPVGPAADIVWVNRGQVSDGFDATFGTVAPTARAVVDAVISMYERMIGSFNYSDNSANFNLTLSMSGSGFGASAGLGSTLGGKPKSGTINMGKGNNAGGNSDQGWFMDPTPFDNSEFMGSIQNAYTAGASGGGAVGRSDFLTVVEAEMTHCMGQFGNQLALWNALTTSTGMADQAHAGTLWVFRGPSIKHLFTSDNGGGASGFAAVHTADPQANITFQSDTYGSTNDQGNAFYEQGVRYLVDNIHSLMFKDALTYSSTDPSQFGTMYVNLNQTSKVLTIKGGSGGSSDILNITRSGSTVTVSLDLGNDPAATGALPGAGNLPAMVTQFDISQLSSIVIQSGDGNDQIAVSADVGLPLTVDSGVGSDTFTITGSSGPDTYNVTSNAVSGSFSIGSLSNLENLVINGGDGDDTVSYNASGSSMNVAFDGANDNDDYTVTNGSNTPISFTPGSGTNALHVLSGSFTIGTDLGGGGGSTSLEINGAGAALASNASQHVSSFTLNGANSGFTLNLAGNRVLHAGSFSQTGGTIDLNDNDAVLEGTNLAAIEALIVSGRNGGTWNGTGITSNSAATNFSTSLGVIEGSDWQNMYGATQFSGENVSNSSILIKYTWYGDANFNGKVDGGDYALIDAHFNQQGTQGDIGGWINGDFDYNDKIDGADYAKLDQVFNLQNAVL